MSETGKREHEAWRASPMMFAAVYALVMPLAVGVFALWLPLKTTGVETLKEWQTLVGGVLAIAAAFIGGGFIYYQTAVARRHEAERVARHHAAARAVLPLALSGMVDYAEEAANALESLRSTIVGRRVHGHAGLTFEVPRIDSSIIDRLATTIESASELVSDRIALIISEIQVLDSRLKDVADRLRPESSSILVSYNLDDYTVNAATIYARCSELFAYARRETDDAPAVFPTADSLRTALRLLGFDETTHEDVFKMAIARAERHAVNASHAAPA